MGGIGSSGTINETGVTITIADTTSGTLDLEQRDVSLYKAIIAASEYISNYAAASFIKSVTQQILDAGSIRD